MALILESDLEHVERPLADTFADRVPESTALAATIARLRHDMATDSISAVALENVLVFYGHGGMGKTALSKCLQAWLDGDLPADFHWGTPPEGPFVTVRWDLRNPEDRTNPTNFLVDLRVALGHHCPASFDLALSALFAKRHPDLKIRDHTNPRSQAISDVMDSLVRGVDALEWVSGVGDLGLSSLVRYVKDKAHQLEGVKEAPSLLPLLNLIEREGSDPRTMPVIAGEMMLLLTRHFDRLPVEKRTLLVTFIDTYEQAQTDPTREQDRLVAHLVAKAPLSLFVITGKNRVQWHTADRATGPFGERRWPCLARQATSDIEPRQHIIGNLSNDDAQALLEQELQRLGLTLSTADIRALAEVSKGYPVHLDAVTYLAREELRFKQPEEITVADLRADHSETIRRILEHLDATTARRALLACAVAPFFDVPLVAAIAGVDEAVALTVVNESLVSQRQAEFFPYHLHDRTRELLRLDAEEGTTFWTPHDWRAAAERALDHLETRHEQALDEDDFEKTIAIHALATRVAAEYHLYESWPAFSFARSPSYEALRVLLADVELPFGSALGDNLALLRALEYDRAERLARLDEIIPHLSDQPQQRAMLWRVYALRDLERHEDALKQLEDLVAKEPESKLRREQIVHTLRMARRFPEAVGELLRRKVDAPITDGILLAHGKLAEAVRVLQSRYEYSLRSKRSYRSGVELRVRELSARQLLGESVAGQRVLDQALSLQVSTASCYAALCHGREAVTSPAFYDVWQELDLRLGFFTGSLENTGVAAELAALRMWATGDVTYMDVCRAHGISGAQTSLWIPVEFLWEYLGHPLPEHPTQWLEPVEIVRQRWLGHYEQFIENLRSHHGH